MKQQVFGLFITVLYVMLCAAQGVLGGNITQMISPINLTFFSFLIVTIVCITTSAAMNHFKFSVLKNNAQLFLLLNIATAGSWLGFFMAVKYIEPALVAIIIGSIGPAFVSIISKIVRPKSKFLTSEKYSAFCFLIIFGYIIYIIFCEKSSARSYSNFYSLLGIIASVICSLSISLITVCSKKLFDNNVSILQSMSFRFFILLFLTAIMAPKMDLQDIAMHDFQMVLGFALLCCLLPIFLGQLGTSLLEPIVISFLMALESAFALILEIFDDRLIISNYSLLVVIISSCISIFAVGSRLKFTNSKITNR